MKSPLIDSNPEIIGNEAEGASHRERLSEGRSLVDHATVRPLAARKLESAAEMPAPAQASNNVRNQQTGCPNSTSINPTTSGKAVARPILSVTSEEAAYFAGLVDGEGCINPYLAKNKFGVKNIGVLQIAITNTHKDVLLEARVLFGGSYPHAARYSRGSVRPIYSWYICNVNAIAFLKLVFPYLRIKKRQAALAFKFREVMTQNLKNADAHRLERLNALMSEIKDLNGYSGAGHKKKRAETVKGELDTTLTMSQSIVPAHA